LNPPRVNFPKLVADLLASEASEAEMKVTLALAGYDGEPISIRAVAKIAGISLPAAEKGIRIAAANNRIRKVEVRSEAKAKAEQLPRWRFEVAEHYLYNEITQGPISFVDDSDPRKSLSEPIQKSYTGGGDEAPPVQRTDTGSEAPIEPITHARARSNSKPFEEEEKKEETRVVGNGKGKNGATAPAGAPPDRTAEDSKREEFLGWLDRQPDEYRELFAYAAPAMGAPPATTSSRKRAEAASVVRMLLADGADVELFKAVRAAYSADPWRSRDTGRAIPLNPTILRDRWAELRARVEGAEEGRASPADEREAVKQVDAFLAECDRMEAELEAELDAKRNGSDDATRGGEVVEGVGRDVEIPARVFPKLQAVR
jgi:hypothetical protein